MGFRFSKIAKKAGAKEHARVTIVGLDAAGKTTLLYWLKMSKEIITVPTIGFNVEKLFHKNLELTMFDIAGHHKLRSMWRNYYKQCDALVFVVDSHDQQRLEQAKSTLHTVLNDPLLKRIPVLIFANKQDLPNAVPKEKLVELLNLQQSMHRVQVQPCVATTGKGVFEGMDWIHARV